MHGTKHVIADASRVPHGNGAAGDQLKVTNCDLPWVAGYPPYGDNANGFGNLESLIPAERIERAILLDSRPEGHAGARTWPTLYGVETTRLVQAVKRNIERFPDDFMFQLDRRGVRHLEITNCDFKSALGRSAEHAPYAFTEQGVAMLSSVLRSPRAVAVNIEIMRAFVRLRQMLASHADLARKLDALERQVRRPVQGRLRRHPATDGPARRPRPTPARTGFHARGRIEGNLILEVSPRPEDPRLD